MAFEDGKEEFPGRLIALAVKVIALLPRHPQEESLPLVHDMLLAAYPHRAASGQGILEEIGFRSPAVLQVVPGGMPGLPADGHQLYERLLHVLQEMERVIVQYVRSFLLHQKITLPYQILTVEKCRPFLYDRGR